MKVILLILIVFLFASCANDLMQPSYNYYKVVWCDYNSVTICNGLETIKIKNADHEPFFVDDFLILNYYTRF